MDRPETYVYPAILTSCEDGKVTVTFPDLDASTKGDDELDALEMACDCLGMVMMELEENGEIIPEPSLASQIRTDESQHVELIDVHMPFYRLIASRCANIDPDTLIPADEFQEMIGVTQEDLDRCEDVEFHITYYDPDERTLQKLPE